MSVRKEAAGALAAIGGGIYTLVTGLFDPTFLLDVGAWFPIAKGITRYIGPQLLPSVSWSTVSAVLGLIFILASLYRLGKRNTETQ